MEQVAPGIWRGGTRYVNWYVVDAGADGLTLVDAGLPRYGGHLDGSLQALGRTRSDVRAVVLTHGHVDHTGMAAELARSGATVHLHPADQALAADPRTNRPERTLPYLLLIDAAGKIRWIHRGYAPGALDELLKRTGAWSAGG